MNRALAALTVGAYLTLVLQVMDSPRGAAPLWPAPALGALYSLVATAGFTWVHRRRDSRGHLLRAAGYVAVQLPLGFALFGVAGASVGTTLLLVVLVAQSVLLLPLAGAAAVTAAVPLVHVGMSWTAGLREGIGLLLAAVFAATVTALLDRERRARAELAVANAQLRAFAAQAEELATTQERNRVARDIHDGLGHYLTVIQMQVQAARAVLPTDSARADAVLAKAQRQSQEALGEVRRSVAALREPRAERPLPAALQALVAETVAAGMPADLEVAGPVRPVPTEAAESLYRAAQEGLTNVRKHARAGHAQLVLDYSDAATVRLEVRDDGTGVVEGSDDGPGPGFGLLGLRERAARLGGQVIMDSVPGQGSTLRIEVPT